jgi:hypothetical protein
MALPPKGDPRRRLVLAARSMRAMGILCLIAATCAMRPWFFLRRGRVTPYWISLYYVVYLLLYLVPGILYLLSSIFIKRGRSWAIVMGMVLAALSLVVSLLMCVGGLVIATTDDMVVFVGVLIFCFGLLLTAALVRLVFHLGHSFKAIKLLPPESIGFEPLMYRTAPQPVIPLDPSAQSE